MNNPRKKSRIAAFALAILISPPVIAKNYLQIWKTDGTSVELEVILGSTSGSLTPNLEVMTITNGNTHFTIEMKDVKRMTLSDQSGINAVNANPNGNTFIFEDRGVTFKIATKSANVHIYGADGALVKEIRLKEGEGYVSLNDLAAGAYILSLDGSTLKFILK